MEVEAVIETVSPGSRVLTVGVVLAKMPSNFLAKELPHF